MLVYAIIDIRCGPDHPLGDAVETFIRREAASQIEDEPVRELFVAFV